MRPVFPKTVRILGQQIRNMIVPDELVDEGHDLVGLADFQHGKVFIVADQSPDQFADTTVHEWLHIMLKHIGHDSEEVAGGLAPVLLDFIRKNPKAIAFLRGSYYL